ncbi:hypothetical protein I4U23_029649 [Adineta vaga]|nr:hypothetical protein I4U23_029649 [Adineta vaga]
MNALETEYSFLAPTWKLPPVATPSMYSRAYGAPYASNELDNDLDWVLWKNTLYNSRHIPSYLLSSRSSYDYSMPTNQQRPIIPSVPSQQQQQQQQQQQYYQIPNVHPKQSHSFHYQPPNSFSQNTHTLQTSQTFEPNHNQNVNREITYSTAVQNNHSSPSTQKRRVQIIDHNRRTPSRAINDHTSGRNSYNSPQQTSNMNKSQMKSKSSVTNQENRFGYTGNHFNIHEYLYGLSAPDPGSYVDAFRHHQRRLQDEKLTRKFVLNDYKNFAQNGGFGPAFGKTDHGISKDKVNNQNRRTVYAKEVRENNQQKVETQRRLQTSYSQQRNPTGSVPKYQRAREYADTIEKPRQTKSLVRLRDPMSGNVIIPDALHQSRQNLIT